ncbi:hypothetical protein [Salinivibrio sp. VYel1]|uniref:hypothetical protein n=1 Tax=Salinivibrio sp. VYel1 TaxID=2490490 RepID=UPI00128CFE74|nr:hypothetical protein [Salinivibrio sp. VYel1]MPX89383.1 hypothetical protein [Salinivibrio sp. VYel1]
MDQLHNSLTIFHFFKEKFERDQFLVEFSVEKTKKYGKRCKEIAHFNEDLKQTLFLKQIIDVCAFLDGFNLFKSLGRNNERVSRVCKQVKPALKRIDEVKGLRAYRNALVAHNFRIASNKEDVVLLSDYSKNPDYPNSIAEVFFLSAICSTIIEAVSTEFNNEFHEALKNYNDCLEDDRSEPLRGVKTIRQAYDEVEKLRLRIQLEPKFIEHEFTEFNMALDAINWDVIPSEFELSEEKTNKFWCEVLGLYLQMRGYENIKIIKGSKGRHTNHWLELYGYTITVTNGLDAFKSPKIREIHELITNLELCNEENSSQPIKLVYKEIMKVVTP